MADQKRVFIKTYGCQMNVYDSERMHEALVAAGYEAGRSMDESDLIILNTCHIREKASEKIYSELGRIRTLKKNAHANGRTLNVAVAGCVAQAEGEEISRRAPVVDLVFGPQVYHRLPQMLDRVHEGEKVVELDFPTEEKFAALPDRLVTKERSVTAFVTVQEGCDKFCSFCVVPYTRGVESSRPASHILNEIGQLVEQGVKEITLIGQNVNAYSGQGQDNERWGLAQLLHAASALNGLERLRYTTSHPRDMSDDLIEAHRTIDKLTPYLHLPVQSGSDSVLKAMNRQHGRDDYFRLIDRIREARPAIALSGDFIVGFPGETDADFEDTLDLVQRVGYAQSYSFKYSPRPGTPGAVRDDQVDEKIKSERLVVLQSLLASQQLKFNQEKIGSIIPILLEKPGRTADQLVGRSAWLQPVHMTAMGRRIGDLVDVAIINANSHSLTGRLDFVPSVESSSSLQSHSEVKH